MRRVLLACALVGLLGGEVSAQVAYDSLGSSSAGTTDRSWTHTPVGTLRAVVVLCNSIGTGDGISGVTYDGEAMTEVSGSPLLGSTAGLGSVYAYFLGSGINTGAVTVTATVANGDSKRCYSYGLTANADTEVVDTSTLDSAAATDPSVTVSLSSRTSWAALAAITGHDANSDTAPLTDWTSVSEQVLGSNITLTYRYNTVGTTDVTAGYTALEEEAVLLGIAISEVQAGASAATPCRPGSGFFGPGCIGEFD